LKRFLLPIVALSGVLLVAGCNSSTTSSGGSSSNVSGTVTLNGSSALDPLVKGVTDDFQSQYPQVTLQSTPTDSGTGVSQVAAGTVQIGMSDFAKSAVTGLQNADQLVDHQVAVSGLEVIAHKDVGADNLTSQQVHDIFAGKITNWKDAGGSDVKIVLVGRKASSGTRKAFDKLIMKGDAEASGPTGVQEQPSAGNLVTLVQGTPGAIGYVGFGDIKADFSAKQLSFEGVKPTNDNIVAGTYSLWFHEHMYTKGEASGATKAFLDYLTSDKVQNGDSFTKAKFIAISKVKGTSAADS
jgi:phosphate transport system substrate-binding protein